MLAVCQAAHWQRCSGWCATCSIFGLLFACLHLVRVIAGELEAELNKRLTEAAQAAAAAGNNSELRVYIIVRNSCGAWQYVWSTTALWQAAVTCSGASRSESCCVEADALWVCVIYNSLFIYADGHRAVQRSALIFALHKTCL